MLASMQGLKRLVVLVCGLLLAGQSLASSTCMMALHPPSTASHAEHCAMHTHGSKQAPASSRCCAGHCPGMAGCFGTLGHPSWQTLRFSHAAPLPAPNYRIGDCAPPDPETRLRPPTPLLA